MELFTNTAREQRGATKRTQSGKYTGTGSPPTDRAVLGNTTSNATGWRLHDPPCIWQIDPSFLLEQTLQKSSVPHRLPEPPACLMPVYRSDFGSVPGGSVHRTGARVMAEKRPPSLAARFVTKTRRHRLIPFGRETEH